MYWIGKIVQVNIDPNLFACVLTVRMAFPTIENLITEMGMTNGHTVMGIGDIDPKGICYLPNSKLDHLLLTKLEYLITLLYSLG